MAELVVALDFPGAAPALAMAERLRPEVSWFKVGMELFTAAGPDVVHALKDAGGKVFLDMKFHDIPNTVRGAVASAAGAGADMLTLHGAGGRRMLESALEGRKQAGSRCALVAVTVLTSMAREDLPWDVDLAAAVGELSVMARDCGLDGVVCSGHEVGDIKVKCGGGFLCVTPGIRPSLGGGDDQRRTMTPERAVQAGADYLVVGRPVTAAESPPDAARAILSAMSDGGAQA